jgi:hypothetical protein
MRLPARLSMRLPTRSRIATAARECAFCADASIAFDCRRCDCRRLHCRRFIADGPADMRGAHEPIPIVILTMNANRE